MFYTHFPYKYKTLKWESMGLDSQWYIWYIKFGSKQNTLNIHYPVKQKAIEESCLSWLLSDRKTEVTQMRFKIKRTLLIPGGLLIINPRGKFLKCLSKWALFTTVVCRKAVQFMQLSNQSIILQQQNIIKSCKCSSKVLHVALWGSEAAFWSKHSFHAATSLTWSPHWLHPTALATWGQVSERPSGHWETTCPLSWTRFHGHHHPALRALCHCPSGVSGSLEG